MHDHVQQLAFSMARYVPEIPLSKVSKELHCQGAGAVAVRHQSPSLRALSVRLATLTLGIWSQPIPYVQGHASQMSRDERPETDPIDFNLLAAMDSRGLGSQPFLPCTQNTQVGIYPVTLRLVVRQSTTAFSRI